MKHRDSIRTMTEEIAIEALKLKADMNLTWQQVPIEMSIAIKWGTIASYCNNLLLSNKDIKIVDYSILTKAWV